LELDIVVDSKDYEIDMQYGLETLKGTSDAVSLIAEAILEDKVGGRRTHKSNGVRTKLKQSFKGSFGQRFALEITKPELKLKLKKMGDSVFLEALSCLLMEGLYFDYDDLSAEAHDVLEEMDYISNDLYKRINSALINMHQLSRKYNQNVTLRHRKYGAPFPQPLIKLTSDTCSNITDTEIDVTQQTLEVIIVRYHSKTGNGRFHIKGVEEFSSFGFGTTLISVQKELRKKISKNLHDNNTKDIGDGDGEYIKLVVKTLKLPTGKIVKYLVVGIEE